MQAQFKCPNCSQVFEAEGVKFEYHSPVYGPCSKSVSESPCYLAVCQTILYKGYIIRMKS
jgi:hypothetical protein